MRNSGNAKKKIDDFTNSNSADIIELPVGEISHQFSFILGVLLRSPARLCDNRDVQSEGFTIDDTLRRLTDARLRAYQPIAWTWQDPAAVRERMLIETA